MAQASKLVRRSLVCKKVTDVFDIAGCLISSMEGERSTNVVHIKVFKERQISIKDLPHSIKCKHLKMEMEIMTGLSANIDYSLCFPKNNVLDDNYEIIFGDNIVSGVVFTVQFPPSWIKIINLLGEDNCDCLIKHVRIVTDTLSREKAEELIFCIIFLASSIGNVKTLKSLYQINQNSLNKKTLFKRTCAHSAAYQDNISILYELNQRQVDMEGKDIFGKTPCNIAENAHAQSSVRFFRELIKCRACLTDKSQAGVQKSSKEANERVAVVEQGRRICSAPSTSSRRQRKVGWTADTDSGIETCSFTDTRIERTSSSASYRTRTSTCRTVILEDWESDFLKNQKLESQRGRRCRKENLKMDQDKRTEKKMYYKTKYHTGEDKETDWSKRYAK